MLEAVQFGTRVHVAYFTGVTNAPEIRTALVEASRMPDDQAGRKERARLDWSFIDAKMVRFDAIPALGKGLKKEQVASRGHLLAAVHLALLLKAQGEMRTKTVHSEILWTLCPTSNVHPCLPFCSRREALMLDKYRLPMPSNASACPRLPLRSSSSSSSLSPPLTPPIRPVRLSPRRHDSIPTPARSSTAS